MFIAIVGENSTNAITQDRTTQPINLIAILIAISMPFIAIVRKNSTNVGEGVSPPERNNTNIARQNHTSHLI